ncbi:hypothetical protein [Helicobacter ailurogastricus]|uniref:Uncharacterized protein n=1 Tax=Helicobacter ailurogastricus TaxID=1578720 RepID=A0A0K2Y665_9HELI|nr:hypothetical protein [Helicobacter ailurogastricus]BDQ28965.1 hypothetical protein ASB7_08020 [Helicobacter ailurogastricus]CRI32473.1 hypothetical protein HAL07_09480 [Helicobacter ailurogastricus]
MQLYNKIQEFIQASQKTKQESIALLEQARTTLSAHLDARLKRAMDQLNGQIAAMIQEQMQALSVQENLPNIVREEAIAKLNDLEANIQAQIVSRFLNSVEKRRLEERIRASLQEPLAQSVAQFKQAYQQRALEDLNQMASTLQRDFEENAKPLILQGLKEEAKSGVEGVLQKAREGLEQRAAKLLERTQKQAQGDLNALKATALNAMQEAWEAEAGGALEEAKFAFKAAFANFKEDMQREVQAGILNEVQEAKDLAQAQLGAHMADFVAQNESFMELVEQRLGEALQQDFKELLEDTLSRLDTEFLREKRARFFSQVEKDLDALLIAHLDNTSNTKFKFLAKEFFQETNNMRLFREMQLEAQLHLTSLIQSHALKILEEETGYLRRKKLEELEFNNQLRMGLKRQELIKAGIIEEKEFKRKGTKAHLVDR